MRVAPFRCLTASACVAFLVPGVGGALAAAGPGKKAEVDVTGMGVNYTTIGAGSAYTGPKAYGRLVETARCLVRRAHGAAEKLLETTPESLAESNIRWGPIRSRLDQCSQMYMGATGVVLRGAIAQVLYEEKFGARPPAPSPTAVPLAYDWPATGQTAAQLATIYSFADCFVAAQPAGVRQLVLTAPGSAEESAALRALRPHFASCLVKDVTFNTNRETMRAVLTESLHRWSLAQAKAAPAPGGSI
ncbi:MAG TPA: hypothetical protein VF718_06460 [Allosphingosinicella sp.]|jgi:hypothetical protein